MTNIEKAEDLILEIENCALDSGDNTDLAFLKNHCKFNNYDILDLTEEQADDLVYLFSHPDHRLSQMEEHIKYGGNSENI